MPNVKFFLTIFFAAFSITLFAQVGIQIRMTYPNYMRYDSIHVRMALRNYSSHPITFGDAKAIKGMLRFEILADSGMPIKPSNRRPLLRGVILGPGETKTFTFNLQNYFKLYEPGRYRVRAIVSHPQLPSAYESNRTIFSVRTGTCVWEREFGLPDYTGKNAGGKIRTRNYKFYSFDDGRNAVFYMMIDDAERVYAIRRIAFDLGENLKPQYTVDPQARFHILVAVSPKVFAHYVYSPEGKLEKRDVLLKRNSTPFLVVEPATGIVRVDGGDPARKDVDYEEIKDLPFMDEVKDDTGNKQFGDIKE